MPVLKFEDVPFERVNERMKRKIIFTENLMTVLVEFSGGPWPDADPLHNHPHQQTSYVAEGEVIFYSEGEPERLMKTGDMIAFPPFKKHAVKLISKSAQVIDSFTPIREDFVK